MPNNDIYELLDYTKNEISIIYEQSKIGKINKIALKNTLENLRSILDYSAQVICKKLKHLNTKEVREKVYFPYGQRKNHFLKSIANNLPNLLNYNPSIYILLESLQPFISNDSWLVDLCSLTNDVKHNELSKTENRKTMTVYQGGVPLVSFGSECRNVRMRGNRVNGVLQDEVHIDDNGVFLIKPISGQTYFVENNSIMFNGKEIEVVSFLNKCHKNIENFVQKLALELNA